MTDELEKLLQLAAERAELKSELARVREVLRDGLARADNEPGMRISILRHAIHQALGASKETSNAS